MSSSSNPSSTANPLGSQGVSEKLTRDNYLLWEAIVLPAVRGARLMGFLDGTAVAPSATITVNKGDKSDLVEESNPAYEAWVQTDQQVLSYLLNSFSKEILMQVVGMKTATQVWTAVKTMFAKQSRTRVANLRFQLTNTKKEGKTTPQFFAKMKNLADELAAAGRPIEDEELVEYILAGLDDTYNPIFAAIGNNTTDLTVSDLYAQVVSYDNRMALLGSSSSGGFNSSINSAARGRGGGRGRAGGRGAPRGRGGRGYGRGNYNNQQGGGGGTRRGGFNNNKGGNDRPICQICGKQGHEAWKCWYRYNEEEEEERGANTATTSYGVDTNWYTDTGATDHITGELDKLTVKERYNGRDQVHAANGAGNEENST